MAENAHLLLSTKGCCSRPASRIEWLVNERQRQIGGKGLIHLSYSSPSDVGVGQSGISTGLSIGGRETNDNRESSNSPPLAQERSGEATNSDQLAGQVEGER